MLSIVSSIANYFGKSNYGTHHLNKERKKQGVAEGIKSNSETHFSSSYYQVVSVSSCMNVIRKCLKSKKLKFDTAVASEISYDTDSCDATAILQTKKLIPYIEDSVTYYGFMAQLSDFIHLLAGAANGLLTLEGQNMNCTDVFYVWVCIAYELEQVLANPSLGVSEYRASIIEAYNHRFNQMMTESSHRVFLLAYYLHPCEFSYLLKDTPINVVCAVYWHHGGLQLILPPQALVEGHGHPTISQFSALGRTLLSSVLEIFKGEQLRLQDSGSEVVPQLAKEFIAYAYNKEPFSSQQWTRDTKPLKWWIQVSKDSNARLIGVSGTTYSGC